MSKWIISKEFHGDFGHRVFNQTLNKEYSLDNVCACKHMHGHSFKIIVHLEGTELTEGFLTDYKHLNWFKKFIDENIDHRFLLSLDDPWFVNIINAKPIYKNNKLMCLQSTQPLNTKEGREIKVDEICVPGTNHFTGYLVNDPELSGHEKDFVESFFLTDWVPTSENICHWLYHCVNAKMSKINIKVSKVEWFETPKSRSEYTE